VVINFLIEHQCPQCGAPAILEETDRLFTCNYCRVNSYLIADDFFRYMLPYPAVQNRDVVFFPYWRFKGMLFFCGPSGITHRFVDVSHQAIATPYFPISVGLRSQAMKLRFVTPETEGQFLNPGQSFEKIANTFEQRFGRSLPKPIWHQSHIGDTLSLIYAPFYIKDRLYDAILDKAVSSGLPEDFDINGFAGSGRQRHIHFVATLCPNCGWNLEGQRNALVLSCKNCNSSWYPMGKKLKQLKFAQITSKDANVINLPFWRIRADTSGIDLKTYGDLIKIANLPRIISGDQEKFPFRFWIPAFKVRPKVFLRLASHITLSQPRQELSPNLPNNRIHPSTLPIEEAIESLVITLADLIKPRRKFLDELSNLKIEAKGFTLVYLPFEENHHEFIQREFHLAINKNVMALSTNL
jgi:hypothetical protein